MIIHLYKGEFGIGGLETTTLAYCTALARAGHEVVLATSNSAYPEAEVRRHLVAGSSFHILDSFDSLVPQFMQACDLMIVANAHRPDNTAPLFGSWRSYPLHLINRLGNLPSCQREWGRLSSSNHVFVQSSALAHRIQDRMPAKNQVLVVPNPVDYHGTPTPDGALVRQTHGLQGQTILFYPGRIVHRRTGNIVQRKGLAVLLHAFAKLIADRPNLVLLIGGADPSCASIVGRARHVISATLENLGVPPDGVAFLSYSECAPWNIGAAFVAADVVVQPNVGSETYGNVVVESLMRGRPFVGSPLIRACKDLANELNYPNRSLCRPVILVPPNSPSFLAEAIIQLLDVPAARRTAEVLSSIDSIRRRHSPDRLLEAVATVVRRVKDGSNRASGGEQ